MTCREVVEFLMAYLDGELPEEERRVFEEHLAECEECVAYLASYQRATRLGATAWEEEPCEAPPELVDAILAARRA